MQSLEDRIKALESKYKHQEIPGTSISRVLNENGPGWCLSVGPLNMPKAFFYGDTIEECFSQAEAEFNSGEIIESVWGDII